MRLLPCGDRALLVEHDDPPALRRALLGTPGVEDLVPAARTLLVTGPDVARLRAAVLAARPAPHPPGAGELVELPVLYDGPDLADVAAQTGLTPDEVVARHSGAEYRVAFGGFLPGFAYLVGLDPRLHVPRRATPRTRVPAGSVAVAGPYSAVYPRASPGGWSLLGTCPALLFDADRDPPALLPPGTRVRFVP